LQKKIAAKFPVQKKVLEVFSVAVAAPSLTMQPQNNRIAAELKLTVHDRLADRDYPGVFAASFGLRFDPDALVLKLVNVRVNKMQINGMHAFVSNAFGNLGKMLVEDQLEGYVVYRFKPEDLRSADRFGYTVGNIDVGTQGLLVRLLPKS